MTAQQAIAALDELTPNSYDFRQKLVWLGRVEAGVAAEVFDQERKAVGEETPLLAQEPYDELYLRYLQAQIYLEAGEITRYNNAMALYNNALAALRRAYIRSQVSHRPQLTGF